MGRTSSEPLVLFFIQFSESLFAVERFLFMYHGQNALPFVVVFLSAFSLNKTHSFRMKSCYFRMLSQFMKKKKISLNAELKDLWTYVTSVQTGLRSPF